MTLTDETITKLDVDALVDELLAELPPSSTDAVAFLGEQFDRGLAFVQFPVGCGGLAGSPADQVRAQRRLIAGGAPVAMMRNVIGYGMVAPTLVTHGTERQRKRYLRPLFTGEEVWCQLFSEPGAGSDAAGAATRAVADGDEWVVNGQKVWTTLAHLSRFGLLLGRTDPDAPKHAGMTMFLVDGERVGMVWVGPSFGNDERERYLYNVEIDVVRRGRGYGRAAVRAAEAWAQDQGASRLSLNVWGNNHVARSLYDSMGYVVAAPNMFRDL